ncbi:hypothetical protein [Proteiniborus sp. MB09-C3]|uniref:hypothetical protein n=1 Tax=Proteiniborus sp. MB09-C3 TaxID=3050072 RepID=UPI0025576B8E|nr:hypothetical protein [Proteiniborus sp. MB09-C3]WIV13580.1 hypothetical protein QO263_07710 [Proteiniborus sp. MB09-C3]
MVKNKIIIRIIIILIAIIGVGSFISYSKFGVVNPFSTAKVLCIDFKIMIRLNMFCFQLISIFQDGDGKSKLLL